jgi:hypothetical protein
METETAVSIVTILIAVIAAVVSIQTAANTARKDAFEQLKKVVERQACEIKDLKTENEDLRGWAESLVNQLIKAKIVPHPYMPRRKVNCEELVS